MSFLYTEFIYFVIYSFLGWICETIYCSAYKKEFVNRGFLTGPFCPIYAFGALSTIILFYDINNVFELFFLGALIASIIEYITSYILECAFKLKLWDYSERKFNLNGRICLKNSFMFGIMALITVMYIHPFIERLITNIDYKLIMFISICLFIYFILDIILTIYNIIMLNGALYQLGSLFEEVNEKYILYKQLIQQNIEEKLENIKKEKEEQQIKIKDYIDQLNCKISKLHKQYNKPFLKRIIKAFPDIRSLKYQEPLNKIIEEIKKYRNR